MAVATGQERYNVTHTVMPMLDMPSLDQELRVEYQESMTQDRPTHTTGAKRTWGRGHPARAAGMACLVLAVGVGVKLWSGSLPLALFGSVMAALMVMPFLLPPQTRSSRSPRVHRAVVTHPHAAEAAAAKKRTRRLLQRIMDERSDLEAMHR